MANIAEILKNAPKGLKLYSPIAGRVIVIKVLQKYFEKN